MRYTKYDYRKKNKNKLGVIFPFLIIISLGVVLGITIFKLIFMGDNSILNICNSFNSEEAVSKEDGVKLELRVIQCGLYGKKENAENSLLKIPSNYSRFILEEDGKFKVMAGIYTIEDVETKKSELEKNSINNFIIKYDINEESVESKIRGEILSGYLKIINKIFNEDVKTINTKEFKIWATDLSGKNLEESEDISNLLEKINSLPEEYQRQQGEEDIIYLYKMIAKYKNY